MATIAACTHYVSKAPIRHFFNSVYSDQTLVLKVASVFFVCLAVVVAWVIFRTIKGTESVVEGRLWILRRTTGSIGKDRRYKFSETLQLENGDPLQVAATDLYVNTMIHYKGKDKPVQDLLPSSLFVLARQRDEERDQVCFRKDGKLHRLTLVSSPSIKGEVSFDDCLRNVERQWHYYLLEFLHEEDVPESYKKWSLGLAPVFLSPSTRQVFVGQKGAMPINLNALQTISTKDEITILGSGELPGQNIFQYQLAACGLPKITILVDRQHLYVHTFKEMVLEPGYKWCGGSLRYEYFFHDLLVKNGAHMDTINIEAALDNTGVLTINIPLICEGKRKFEHPGVEGALLRI